MKALILAALISIAFATPVHSAFAAQGNVAKKSKKSEPAPKDSDERQGGNETPDSREETYEGNDRGGGSFDGGGHEGSGGGMGSELFSVKFGGKTYPVGTHTKTEDRGNVIVYTTTTQEDISADETCTTVTTVVVDKATRKVLSTDSDEFCNRWPL